MSVDYAAGLSHYDDLGDCGSEEIIDPPEVLEKKVCQLAKLILAHRGSCILHVGAGLSTAAGIRDFRGRNGVWTETLQKNKSSKPDSKHSHDTDIDLRTNNRPIRTKPFDETEPTISHMAIKKLCETNYISHVISQNVDGLFLKSGLLRKYISELHGNFYLDECTRCRSRFIRNTASSSMKLQKSNINCPRLSKICKGYLRDTILDWESPIPHQELRASTKWSKEAKLHICIGTSLQLRPSKDLVCNPEKTKSKSLVIINLQRTSFDPKANLVIHNYVDDVFRQLMSLLKLEIPTYNRKLDPTKDFNKLKEQWKR